MRSAYITLFVFAVFASVTLQGQESPYFVTYDHHLEEPGNLEIETSSTVGVPRAGQHWFFAPYLELEYGVTGRWTSELYLEGQSTAGDSTIFTGWRIENRFRPLAREHWINPVLYLEYENINEASRIRKEIVGAAPELNESNAELRATRDHELETRLILSSTAHDWNISENQPSFKLDRKSTRLNSSHDQISYAVFCLKKKKKKTSRRSVDRLTLCTKSHSLSSTSIFTHAPTTLSSRVSVCLSTLQIVCTQQYVLKNS